MISADGVDCVGADRFVAGFALIEAASSRFESGAFGIDGAGTD